MQDFTENFADPAAAMFLTVEILASNLDQFPTVFYFYDGPVVPAGVFDKFLAVPSTGSTTKVQSYSQLVAQLSSVRILNVRLTGNSSIRIPGFPVYMVSDTYYE